METSPVEGNVPQLLSRTGAFTNLATLTPAGALVPYDVNVPQWLNGARARRWISVPSGQSLGFHATDRWSFPPGTVLVEHIDWLPKPAEPENYRRLETRFLITVPDGSAYGVTYRWRADGTDADLVATDDVSETLETRGEKGERVRVLWVYPSPKDCLQCHTPGAGFVLGVKSRQLHRDFAYASGRTDNQLRTWSGLGLLSPAPAARDLARLPALAGLADTTAPAGHRARSYLDANCAHCHGATAIHSAWNASFNIPLESQGIINGAVLGHRPDDRHFIVAPGDPVHSELYQRVSENIIGKRMPPLGSDRVDQGFVRVLAEWIGGLPPARGDATPPPR